MRSLTWKLSVAFLIVSVAGALVAALFIWQATQTAFQNDAAAHAQSQFVTAMTGYYEYHHTWDGVVAYARTLQSAPNPNAPPPGAEQGAAGNGPNTPIPFVLADQQRRVILPGRSYTPGQILSPSQYARGDQITVNGQVVGVVLADGSPPLSAADTAFLTATERALIFGGLAAIVIALALGIVLARSLTRPLRELTAALHAMAAGDLQQVAPVRSRDELGELATAFNTMSANLASANQQRRQMTADIAHDLRTPITVMSGYLEALRDGVLPPTPERFAVMYEEAQRLQRLVEDLRTLSLADAGELSLRPQPIAPCELLDRAAAAYQLQAQQADVALIVEAPDALPPLSVDVARMTQVLGNLISNALRYTPTGGQITLSAQATPQGVQLQVRDTGQGVAPDALPRIFDRFYRADAARAQSAGGSGLGLAIARSLVEAHGGAITVASPPSQGAVFTVTLPQISQVSQISHSAPVLAS